MKVEIPKQILVTLSGQTSRGVQGVEVTEDDGHLIFTLTDGSTLDMGSVMGPQGPQGDTGDTGPQGQQGEKGEKGEKGDKGDKGETGATGATGSQGAKGETGTAGKDGATFTPSVSADGVLSWTNDGGKVNPEAVNIKGEKGDRGETGSGFQIMGYYGTPETLAAAVTSPEAGDAYGVGSGEPYEIYIWDGVNAAWVNNGTIQGVAGADGQPGAPGTDGTTFTPNVSEDGVLSWTNDGGKANPEAVNIKGEKGNKGDKGETGETGATGPQGPKGDTGDTGPRGEDGATPVKGVDYFTEADKAEIAEDAAARVDLSGKQNKITVSGILKGDGAGGVSAAVAGTDYPTVVSVTARQAKITATGILKGYGSGSVSAATAGSDYISPSNLTTRLNRSTNVNAADTNYTTYMARGIALSSEETTPTVNGTIVFVYG